MKYALLVLGLLLIVAGGSFFVASSHASDAGHGWASLIAGTTAVSGGIITLALAGVVKGLDDLKALLANAAALPQVATAETSSEFLLAPNLGPMPAAMEPALPAEIEVPIPEAESPAIVAAKAPSPPPVKERPRFAAKFARSAPEAPASAIAELRPRLTDDLALGWPGLTSPQLSPTPEAPAVAEDRFEDSGAFAPPPPLHFDDFSSAETYNSSDDAIGEDAGYADITAQDGASAPMPRAATMPAASRAPAAPVEPKAIGRYEAAGTLYVMFSDGSIEAQSPQGTRRFNSMADLKASFQS
jgi:hypothetical protein